MAFPLLAVPPIIEGALALTALAMATSITLQNYMDASPRLPKDKGLEPPITPSVDAGFSIDDGDYKTYEGSYPELDEQTKKILSEEEFKTPVSEDMSILTSQKLKTKKLGEGYHEGYIDNKTFGISKQGGQQFGGPVFWNVTINDTNVDSFNTLGDAKNFIEENYSEFEMDEELTEKTTEEYESEVDEMIRRKNNENNG